METYRFLFPALAGRKRILEVGCGRGALAAKLGAQGFALTALDQSLKHVEARDAAGVTFVERDFLAYEAEPFEAIFFVTSLHHVSPLDSALRRAHELLVPGGLLLIDEFSVEAPDAQTARWYYELQELLALSGLYHSEHIHGSAAETPLARWSAEHQEDPPLNTGSVMTTAVAQRFEVLETTLGPYLYRYLGGGLRADEQGQRLARFILESEKKRIAEGTLRPVGLRLIARKR